MLVTARAAEPRPIGPPPESLREQLQLAPFYEKYLDDHGLPVISSARVADAALREAAFLVDHMLSGRDDIRQAIIQNKVRLVVMAHNEFTTMVPEHSDLTPAKYWDRRARGLGATPARPAISCGEENLLCYPGDPYATENILIHEFAHVIHQLGLNDVDPTFEQRLQEAYDAALKDGLWKDTYAGSNPSEYWAEGVQSWFDCNRENDAQHNQINTREELVPYDSRLAKLLEEAFGKAEQPEWRYQRPAERSSADQQHLIGFEPQQAPRFSWPANE